MTWNHIDWTLFEEDWFDLDSHCWTAKELQVGSTMPFNIIAVLESDAAAYPADTDAEFEIERGPVIRWPVDLVGRLNQDFYLSWHHCVTFNFEAWPLGAFFLNSSVANPQDPRWFAFKL